MVEIRGPIDGDLLRQAVEKTFVSPAWHRLGCAPTIRTIDLHADLPPRPAVADWIRANTAGSVESETQPDHLIVQFRRGSDHFLWLELSPSIRKPGLSAMQNMRQVAAVYGRLAGAMDAHAADEAAGQCPENSRTWLRQLTGRAVPQVPADGVLPLSSTALRRTAEISAEYSDLLRDVRRRLGVSWTALASAATADYLHRLTAARDVVVAIPHLPPLRLAVNPGLSLSEHLRGAHHRIERILTDWNDPDYEPVPELELAGHGGGRSAVVMACSSACWHFTFAECPATVWDLTDHPVADLSVAIDSCGPRDGRLALSVAANPARHGAGEVARHLRGLVTLFEGYAAAELQQPLARIEAVGAAERHQLTSSWNDTSAPVPPSTLPDLLAAQVLRTPEAIAVRDGDTAWSYAELDAAANRLARHLVARGVAPETSVAVLMDRSVDLVVALLAVVKAGGAYVPLDTGYPAGRIGAVLRAADPVLVITHRAAADRLLGQDPAAGNVWVVVDEPGTQAVLAGLPGRTLRNAERLSPLLPDHAVYVIHTSGSSGEPRGVVGVHRGLVNLLSWMQDKFRLDRSDRVLGCPTHPDRRPRPQRPAAHRTTRRHHHHRRVPLKQVRRGRLRLVR